MNAPGYLFSVPGIAMSAVGLVMGFATLGVSISGVTPGVHSMIAGSLLTIVGYQLMSLGVFAAVTSDPVKKPGIRLRHGRLRISDLSEGLWLVSGFSRLGRGVRCISSAGGWHLDSRFFRSPAYHSRRSRRSFSDCRPCSHRSFSTVLMIETLRQFRLDSFVLPSVEQAMKCKTTRFSVNGWTYATPLTPL